MVNPPAGPDQVGARQGPRGRLGLVWLAGLLVAVGAGVATAHGLYEVALAAGVPRMLAWLYPIITDGLALVAYATTTRLHQHGRRYAWTVVVVAAGLSGLTQAGYLAGGVKSAPAVLRFAIGAWPALAAAIVAHLLYLLSGSHHTDPISEPAGGPLDHGQIDTTSSPPRTALSPSVPSTAAPLSAGHAPPPVPAPTLPITSGFLNVASNASAHTPTAPTSDVPTPLGPPDVPPSAASLVHRLTTTLNSAPPPEQHTEQRPDSRRSHPGRVYTTPAADRALTLAREHLARHGRLPTVTELVTLARVARGTAATALQGLRQSPTWQQGGKPANDARSGQ
jgi:hypothetical protein